MAERVRGWLAEKGADPDLERPTDLPALEEARRVNLEKLRRIVARADLITRTWCHRAGVVRAPAWDSAPSTRVRSALETSFAGDVVELGDERVLGIVAAALGWPAGMPLTIDVEALGLTEGGLLSKEDVDDAERQRRLRERSQIKVDGRDVPVGRDHISALMEAASASVDEDFLSQDGQAPLQEMPTRVASRGGSEPRSRYTFSIQAALSDDQREAVGLFGEVAAKAWLERHYADVEWVSGLRNLAMGDDAGSDSLGYDFRARHGRKPLFFEVKAQVADGPEVAEFQLGETEIRAAQEHSRTDAYRILLVTGTLDQSTRRIHELPSPLSRRGAGRYTLLGHGLRYRCIIDSQSSGGTVR